MHSSVPLQRQHRSPDKQLGWHALAISGAAIGIQPLPERTKPAWQVNPQLVPSQLAAALAGGLHATQDVPHESTLLLATHDPSQR
jgi:hypothetical protein